VVMQSHGIHYGFNPSYFWHLQALACDNTLDESCTT
jgi:hypothetical protein